MLAHPVETVANDKSAPPEKRIAELVRERRVTHVVIGLPLRMDGSEGTAAEKVRAFIKRLRPELPEEILIEEIDERLSTVEAQGQLRASGKKAKNTRGIIDQAAATVILQAWLDDRAGYDSMLIDDNFDHEH